MPRTRRREHSIAILVLIALSCGVYCNADHERFFFDSVQLTQDPSLRRLGKCAGEFLRSGLTPGQQFSNVTFAANYSANLRMGLPGFDVTGFLAVNVAIHAVNVCLLYALLVRLRRHESTGQAIGIVIPTLVCASFAVHPLHAASVVYIVQRRGLLAVLFYLAGVHAYLSLRSATVSRRTSAGITFGLLLLGCFLLSIKSKTLGLTLPVALVAFEFCIRAADRDALKRFVRWGIPALAACGLAMLAALVSLKRLDWRGLRFVNVDTGELVTAPVQFLTQMRVLVDYWTLVLLPLPGRLALDHAYALSFRLLDAAVLRSIVLHVVVFMVAFLAARRGRLLIAFGLLLFYVSVIPWLVLPQTEQLVEYKTYLGAAGVALALGGALFQWGRRVPLALTATTLCAVVVAFFAITFQRNPLFKNPIGLWQDVLDKYPRHYRALSNLAESLARAGRFAESESASKQALQINPQVAASYYNLGYAQHMQRRLDDAERSYQTAAKLRPNHMQTHIMLGNVYTDLGRLDQAEAAFRTAIAAAKPDSDPTTLAKAYYNLGNTFISQRRMDEALALFQKAVDVDPDFDMTQMGLGAALEGSGRLSEALKRYRRAVELNPRNAEARQLLDGLRRRMAASPERDESAPAPRPGG